MRYRFVSGLLLACLATATSSHADDADEAFAGCVATLMDRARGAGISDAVVDSVLANASRVERVIELDRNQPEFVRTFADYYDRRVTEQRVTQGRALREEYGALLVDLQQRYGVPPHYLLSFWGLETNFGSYFGSIPTTDALATLACDPRRSDFFSEELIAALRIVDSGDIEAERMQGSWAGAMGHMQFLPSVFLRYAVDGDGDGRKDLWGSVPDALTSAANFLQGLGWTPGLRWGREVRLPGDFDYSLSGRGQPRPLAEWVAMGVRTALGGPLPSLDIAASVMVPAGHEGPAFLVYENFGTIMRWNRSEYYAIAVGRLADRIAGAGRLTRAADTGGEPVTRDEVRRLQTELTGLGFDTGDADGVVGPATSAALREFQKSRGLLADGFVDAEAIDAVSGASAEQEAPL